MWSIIFIVVVGLLVASAVVKVFEWLSMRMIAKGYHHVTSVRTMKKD